MDCCLSVAYDKWLKPSNKFSGPFCSVTTFRMYDRELLLSVVQPRLNPAVEALTVRRDHSRHQEVESVSQSVSRSVPVFFELKPASPREPTHAEVDRYCRISLLCCSVRKK